MATFRLKVSGKIVNVPDGLNLGGAQDFLIQQGIPREEVGLGPPQQPDIPNGQVGAFDVAAGKFFADRIPGMDNSAPAPGGVGGFLGSIAPSVAVGAAVPSAGLGGILAQGGVQAGLERLRKGSDWGSTAAAGAWGAAGTAAGNMASRVVSGIYQMGRAALTRQIVTHTDDALRLASEGTGGARLIGAINRRAVDQAAAASIYQQADNLAPEVLANAADDIGRMFDNATPASYDPTQARQLLDAIPDTNFPGKARIMELANRTDSYTALHRVLRDAELKMARNPQLSAWSDEVGQARQALEASGVGADQALLTRAREGWKNLRNLESIAEVVDTGHVPAGRAMRVFSSETKGYGTSLKRAAEAGTQPETQVFTSILRQLAADKGAATSGTAERLTATAAGLGILGGLASGELTPEQAVKLVAAGAIVSPSLAAASVGTAARLPGAVGGAAGAELGRRLKQ